MQLDCDLELACNIFCGTGVKTETFLVWMKTWYATWDVFENFFLEFSYCTKGLLYVFLSWGPTRTYQKHTYLARETPWSSRRFSVGEAFPLHFGRVDPADHLKCRWLECVIYWWGGLRSRYPLLIQMKQKNMKKMGPSAMLVCLFMLCWSKQGKGQVG